MQALFRWVSERIYPVQDDIEEKATHFGVPKKCNQIGSPEPRSGHRMCADSNFLYMFGGYDAKRGNSLYAELWRYNITTEKWIKLPDEEDGIPKECLSSAMLLWRRKIIVFGGTAYPFAVNNGDQIYIYCLNSFKWNRVGETNPSPSLHENEYDGLHSVTDCQCVKRKIPGKSPQGKYGHSMTLCKRTGDVYIFSGTQGFEVLNELHRFNVITMTWDHIQFCHHHSPNLPRPRYRHEAISNGNEFYIFGGSTLSEECITFETVHSFDSENLRWVEHRCTSNSSVENQEDDDIPETRKAHSCVFFGDSVYMVGGSHNETNQLFSDIWKFSLNEKRWTRYKYDFPFHIAFHASAVTSLGCMYVFGGTDSREARTNKLHKIWLCAPSLKEQTWLKIVDILRKQELLTTETLAILGVPSNFFYRLHDRVS